MPPHAALQGFAKSHTGGLGHRIHRVHTLGRLHERPILTGHEIGLRDPET
jgi:hypothetical protein